jgi:parallel beta-helix repeat protein
MRFKEKRRVPNKKFFVIGISLLIFLMLTVIPLLDIATHNTFVSEDTMIFSSSDSISKDNAIGDPVGDPEVQNLNTSEVFTSIQAAIDDSDTVDGNILEVNSSTYIENILVTKSLTLRGIGTGVNQPLLDGGLGIGCSIAANNVTIENMNISNSSIGIFCNYSGLIVLNCTFWFDSHSIDFNYRKNFTTNSTYQFYANRIQHNYFLIDTIDDFDGAIIINLSLNYQNHSGAAILGDMIITNNSFLLNNSHAYAVYYIENSIEWLQDGSISIGCFNFSGNMVYKDNSGNNAVYFSGSLFHLKNDVIFVDDIIVTYNTVINQTNAAFFLEQYMAEEWSGTTDGLFGNLIVAHNVITSYVSSDGIQISETSVADFQDDSSLTLGEFRIQDNTITVVEGYAIVLYMDNIGYQLQDYAAVCVGLVNISSNELTAGYGLLIDFYQCGRTLSEESSCTFDDVHIIDNVIDCVEYGVHIQQFSYLGCGLSDNAIFIMSDIKIDDNQIESGSDGIYFSQLRIGEDLSGSSFCSIDNLTLNDNVITCGGVGILLTDNVSLFQLGNSMNGDSVVSFYDIGISRNSISASDAGVFIGPSHFGGENDNLVLNSFTIANNSISLCSVGFELENFSISDWCQPTIKNNTVDNCSIGIWLNASYGNLIYNNYFGNTLNAKDDTENEWNIAKTAGKNIIGGSYCGGNFWSDYTGVDGDNDTIGDTLLPYTSQGNIITGGDMHPLTNVTGDLSLTAPTDFIATVVDTDQIDLSWIKGINAVFTLVMQKTGGYPSNISDGSVVYNGTGVSCSNTTLSPGVRYYYRAWSWNNTTQLWSSENASVSNMTWISPLAPSGFSATTVGIDKINLTWVKGGYATHTRIQRTTGSYPEDIDDGITVYNGSSTAASDSGLSEGTMYYYRAWSWNSTSHLWSTSNASASNTTWSIPLAPTNFHTTTTGVNRIDLTWTKGTYATNTRVMQKTDGYPMNISDGSWVYNGTGTSCSNTSLSQGIRYYFRAWSWNTTSNLWSETNVSADNITWNVPLAPTDFTATTIGSNQITLTWTKGTYTTSTRIQRKTANYPADISDGTTVYNDTGSSYPDTGLSTNTTYYYRAWGWNDTSRTWSSENSSVVNSTWTGPLAPVSLSVSTIGTNQMNLSWTHGFRATHTLIMQKTGGYPVDITDGSLLYNGTGTTCSNTSLTPGVRYYFKAWSWNNSSALWSTTNATGSNITWIVPSPPSAFLVITVGIDEINLTWNKGNYATETRIQRTTGDYPENMDDGITVYNGSSTAASDSGLSEGTMYYYRAWSLNSTSHYWSLTNISGSNTTWNIPLATTNFTVTTVDINQINLSWTKGTYAVYTRIMQKTGEYPLNISDGSLVYNGTGENISSSGLLSGSIYYFRAWSWNDSSGIWSVTNTSGYNITGPFPPTGFTATPAGISQINLAWTKGTYANYTQIQRKTGSYPINMSDGVTVYNASNSSFTDTNLNLATRYYYRAWSWNSTFGVWSVTYASTQATTSGGGGGGGENPPPSSEAPTANAGGPYVGYVNQTITFNAAFSTDDVGIIGYRWDWTNDGTWDTDWLTTAKTTHSYTTAGNYTVKLQVQDGDSLRDDDTATVTITTENPLQQAPVADAAGPYHGLTYQSILFNGSRSYAMNASIVNYTWVFGDGVYGYDVSPVHVYESAGTFTVILTIKDSNGLQAIDTTLAMIDLDANKNNISDVIDQAIGADITQDDLHSITIHGVLYYLVDTNHDGVFDAFYNPTTNQKTILGTQDKNLLIDVNGDGHWDYMFDPALGLVTPFVEVITPLGSPWFSVTISIIIFIVILIIVWLYKTGRI